MTAGRSDTKPVTCSWRQSSQRSCSLSFKKPSTPRSFCQDRLIYTMHPTFINPNAGGDAKRNKCRTSERAVFKAAFARKYLRPKIKPAQAALLNGYRATVMGVSARMFYGCSWLKVWHMEHGGVACLVWFFLDSSVLLTWLWSKDPGIKGFKMGERRQSLWTS